jgi:hypothetical protein
MAAPARKQASPLSPADRLASAQFSIAETNAHLAELNERRNAALLADNDGEAAKLAIEIAEMERLALGYRDKVKLLREEVQREEQARREKERAARIEQMEKMLRNEGNAAVEKFTKGITLADEAMRELIAIGRNAQTAHTFQPHDAIACMFTPGSIVPSLQHEMFRIGGTARRYGGMDPPHADITNFPGAKSPRLELLGAPDRVKSLADVWKECVDLALRIMQTGKGSAAVEGVQHQPVGGEPVQLSADEQELAGLLKRQLALAEDPTRETEYDAVVALIAKKQTVVDAARKMETQNG